MSTPKSPHGLYRITIDVVDTAGHDDPYGAIDNWLQDIYESDNRPDMYVLDDSVVPASFTIAEGDPR